VSICRGTLLCGCALIALFEVALMRERACRCEFVDHVLRFVAWAVLCCQSRALGVAQNSVVFIYACACRYAGAYLAAFKSLRNNELFQV
jgi:hypothetical protein